MFRNKISKCSMNVSANIMFDNAYYGDVNINGRIKVPEGKVVVDNNLVTITAYESNSKLAELFGNQYTSPEDSTVRAIIDNKEYIGKKIVVDGMHVFVDDKLAQKATEEEQSAIKNTTYSVDEIFDSYTSSMRPS